MPPRLLYWGLRGLVAASIFCGAIRLALWLHRAEEPLYGDFSGIWSFGQYAINHGVQVYDPRSLLVFQHKLDPTFTGFYPCPYPPNALLIFWLIGLLPLGVAYSAWMSITLMGYVAATFGAHWRSFAALALIALPTTYLTVASGQTGLLSGALMIGGLRYAPTRPVLSGLLFGLLTFKPQLGLLVPVALVAGGYWRVILVAIVTAAILALGGAVMFGWSTWLAWPTSMLTLSHLVNLDFANLAHGMPTVDMGLQQLGAPIWLAGIGQGAVLICMAIVVWRLCRDGLTERAVAAVPIAALLATPYAFVYDLPMVGASLVLEALRRQRIGIQTSIIEISVVFFFIAVLLAMTKYAVPLAPLLLLGLIFWRIVVTPR